MCYTRKAVSDGQLGIHVWIFYIMSFNYWLFVNIWVVQNICWLFWKTRDFCGKIYIFAERIKYKNNMSKEWDIVIERKSNLFNLDFKEVWRYKDLLFMYVKRDIVTLYKQTILGPLWFIIQPILTTIMFMFVLLSIQYVRRCFFLHH